MYRYSLTAISIAISCVFRLSATEIVTDSQGKTVSVQISESAGDHISFRITKAGDKEFFLRYRAVDSLTQPIVLTKNDTSVNATLDGDDAILTVPAPRKPFLLYNIVEHRLPQPPVLDPNIEKALHLAKIKAAQKLLKGYVSSLAETNADIDGFTKSPAPQAIDEIKRLQIERRGLQQKIRDQNDIIESEQAAIAQNDKDIPTFEAFPEAYVLKKIGVVIQASEKKTIVYAFAEATDTVPARAVRVSNLPVLTDFDYGYVVVSNVVTALHPQPFDISVTWKAGQALTLTPVRPVQPVPGTGTTMFSIQSTITGKLPKPVDKELPLVGETTAYRDVVAEIESFRFHGGEVPQVTVKTRGRVVTQDSTTTEDGTKKTTRIEQVQDITLLNTVDLPQVRTHYRFNFTTGIAVSTLRNPDFQKVLTVVADPSTNTKVQYRLDRDRGDRRINGFLGLSYYIRGVDTLRKLSGSERWMPSPTIGFGLTEPLENAFFGVSFEFVRNAQFLWGIHYGKVSELVNRNNVTEEQDATAPVTRKRFHAKPFVGLTLNLKFVDKVFGRP